MKEPSRGMTDSITPSIVSDGKGCTGIERTTGENTEKTPIPHEGEKMRVGDPDDDSLANGVKDLICKE